MVGCVYNLPYDKEKTRMQVIHALICLRQINCGPFSIANATELAFKGNPGTGWGVSTDRRCFPVYIALRYLYGPVKLDWFSYYRSFQGTH